MLNRCVPTPNITELLPSQLDKIVNISSIFTSDDVRLATLTLYKQLPDIGLLALIALALTIVLVTLLRYLAKLMVLLIIFLSCFGMIGSIYISYFILPIDFMFLFDIFTFKRSLFTCGFSSAITPRPIRSYSILYPYLTTKWRRSRRS